MRQFAGTACWLIAATFGSVKMMLHEGMCEYVDRKKVGTTVLVEKEKRGSYYTIFKEFLKRGIYPGFSTEDASSHGH